MKSEPKYRSEAAKKILEDEGGDEGETEGKTLMEQLDETEFPEAQHEGPETLDNYVKKGKYEMDLEDM